MKMKYHLYIYKKSESILLNIYILNFSDGLICIRNGQFVVKLWKRIYFFIETYPSETKNLSGCSVCLFAKKGCTESKKMKIYVLLRREKRISISSTQTNKEIFPHFWMCSHVASLLLIFQCTGIEIYVWKDRVTIDAVFLRWFHQSWIMNSIKLIIAFNAKFTL